MNNSMSQSWLQKLRFTLGFLFCALLSSTTLTVAHSLPAQEDANLNRIHIQMADLAGAWVYDESVEPLSRLETRIIFVGNEQGQRLRDDLVKKGFSCRTSDRNQAACTQLSTPSSLPVQVELKAHQRAREWGSVLTITAASAPPVLIHESDAYNEWQLNQTVVLGGRIASRAHIFHNKMGVELSKLKLTVDGSEIEFYLKSIESGWSLHKSEFINVYSSSKQYDQYQVGLIYRR